MDEKQLQALYDAMNSRLGLGTFDQFKKTIYSDSNYRKAFYDEASTELELGDYTSFDNSLKKKETALQSALRFGQEIAFGSLSEEQKTADALKSAGKSKYKTPTAPPEKTSIDYNDPIKSLLNPIRNKISEIRQLPASESTGQNKVLKASQSNDVANLLNEKSSIENERFGNAIEAKLWLEPKLDRNKLVGTKDIDLTRKPSLDDFTEESIIAATNKENETDLLAVSQYLDNRRVREALASSPTLMDAAIKSEVKKAGLSSKQIEALSGDIPRAMKANILAGFLSDPDLRELAKNDAVLNSKIKEEIYNFPSHNPEAAVTMLAAIVSDIREQKGYNNGLLNAPRQKVTDEIVNELVESGDLPIQYKNLYDQPGIKLLVNMKLKTPGFIENLGGGLEQGISGIGKTAAELTGVRNLYKSKQEQLYQALQEQYEDFEFKPRGVVHQLTTHGGNVTGQVLPTALGGNYLMATKLVTNPRIANSIMIGLQSYGYNKERAIVDLPGASNLEQEAYALVNTGIEVATENIVNDTKLARQLVRSASPEIKSVLKRFTTKEISEEVAKNELNKTYSKVLSKATQFAKGAGKVSVGEANEELASNVLQNTNNQLFGGEKMSFRQMADEAFEVWKTTLMGSGLLGAAGGIVQMRNNPTTSEVVYSMATNPEYYREVMEGQAKIDEEYAKDLPQKLATLQYAAELKNQLDETDLSEEQKQKLLVKSLSEKMLTDKQKSSPDKTIDVKTERHLKEIEIEKKHILNPTGKKELVEEFYDEELIPNSDRIMLENNETGKFEPNKVGAYLKFIAQQANNLGENWEPHEGKAPPMSQYPQQLIEEANERWKKEIEAAQPKIEIDQDRELEMEPISENELMNGEQIVSMQDAETRLSNGERIFIGHEMDEKPFEITSVEQLKGYSPDQMITVPRKEDPFAKSKTSVITPEENRPPNIIEPIKTQDEVIEETPEINEHQPSEEISVTETEPIEDSGAATPTPPVSEKAGIYVERPATELSHRGLQNVANEFSLPDVQKRNRKSDIQLRQDARNTATDWAEKGVYGKNIERLTQEAEQGEILTDEERVILEGHLANLSAELRGISDKTSTEFDAKLKEIKRLKDAGEKTRSEAGAALRIPGGGSRPHPIQDYGDAMVTMQEAVGDTELTEKQKQEVDNIVANYEEKVRVANQRVADMEARFAELESRKGIEKTKKTKEQYKSERDKIRTSIKDKWANAGRDVLSSDIPFRKQLAAIAPDVAKLVKSYIQEGVTEFAEVVKKVHEFIKQELTADIEETDIIDLIAGKYNDANETKVDLQKKLKQIKNKNSEEAVKIRARIESGDFAKKELPTSWVMNPEMKSKYPKEYNEAIDALAAKEQAKLDFDIAVYKAERAKRPPVRKGIDFARAMIATTKAIKSGIDDSAIMIQNAAAMIAHPRSAVKALKEHALDAISEKRFRRYLTELHESPIWDLMVKSGLDITDPKSLKEQNKEEIFDNNLLNKDIIIGGKRFNVGKYTTRPFERAFTSLGNAMRANMFTRIAERMMQEGKTFETHPEDFKSLARVLNTETGRGKLHTQIERASQLVTAGIWSPRLMASRINMLGISELAPLYGGKGYYSGLTPEMRKMAIADIVKFIGAVVALKGFAGWAGASSDNNPKSVTFCTIQVGNKRYNPTGSMNTYVKTVTQAATGEKVKEGEAKDVKRIETLFKFLRGKLTPAAGVTTDLLTGKDYSGRPITAMGELENLVMPLSVNSVVDGVKRDGAVGLLIHGLPSFVGIGVSDERDYEKDSSGPTRPKFERPKIDRPKPEKINMD